MLPDLLLQTESTGTLVAVVVLLLAVVTAYKSIVIVRAYEKAAYTRFGKFQGILEQGPNVVLPFVTKVYRFDMRTQTLDVPQQEAITRDNSPVTADAVVYIKVMDAEKAFLEVDNYKKAVSNLAQTTLRAVLGDLELDDTLSKRAEINSRIREELDEPTDEWGIRVESVEVREVNPSKDVQQAMEQQTSAERRRRAMILEAQGERRSSIEAAQGDKQSNVIRAQGEKQSQILEAQGDAISTVLRAKSAESMGERAVIERGMETLGATDLRRAPSSRDDLGGPGRAAEFDRGGPGRQAVERHPRAGRETESDSRSAGRRDFDGVAGEIRRVDGRACGDRTGHGDPRGDRPGRVQHVRDAPRADLAGEPVRQTPPGE